MNEPAVPCSYAVFNSATTISCATTRPRSSQLAELLMYLRGFPSGMPGGDRPAPDSPAVVPSWSESESGGVTHDSSKEHLFEVIHELVIFFEKLMYFLNSQCTDFKENDKTRIYGETFNGKRGRSLNDAREEFEKGFMKDDEFFECKYFGPGKLRRLVLGASKSGANM